MKKAVYIALLMLVLLLEWSCSSPSHLTSWKDASVRSATTQKILVVGIVNDEALPLRHELERFVTNTLKTTGYNAVSALAEFGEKGLTSLEQEKTYVKLCNRGIDAVMIVALLDEKKEKQYPPVSYKNHSGYYYNRIKNYKTIRPDKIDTTQNNGKKYLLETILFNLSTLAPVYWAQTQPFSTTALITSLQQYNTRILSNMLKKRILVQHASTYHSTQPM